MRDLKLNIELLPKGAWGNDFSRTLSKKDWDTLRKVCYDKANHKCTICGFETADLDAHEVWDFDINTKTQRLKDIIAICSKCHGVKHIRNSQRLGFGENAKKHFMKINNYEGTISILCDKTNKIEWFDENENLLDTKYNFGKKFYTSFSVKDLRCLYLIFKLTGEYGKKVSKKFSLIECK